MLHGYCLSNLNGCRLSKALELTQHWAHRKSSERKINGGEKKQELKNVEPSRDLMTTCHIYFKNNIRCVTLTCVGLEALESEYNIKTQSSETHVCQRSSLCHHVFTLVALWPGFKLCIVSADHIINTPAVIVRCINRQYKFALTPSILLMWGCVREAQSSQQNMRQLYPRNLHPSRSFRLECVHASHQSEGSLIPHRRYRQPSERVFWWVLYCPMQNVAEG